MDNVLGAIHTVQHIYDELVRRGIPCKINDRFAGTPQVDIENYLVSVSYYPAMRCAQVSAGVLKQTRAYEIRDTIDQIIDDVLDAVRK